MSRETFEDWIPIENGDSAIQALNRGSVVERIARSEPMASDTKWIPRSGIFAVASIAKGASYTETSGTNDYVEVIARKIGGIIRIAEEDLVESTVDVISTKKVDAARQMGYFFDNATLAVSAAANGTTIPYDSVLRAVRVNDTNVSYTADANYTSGSATYTTLSTALSKVEDSIWFDEPSIQVIASPVFKNSFRIIVDAQSRPIFIQGTDGTPDTLFGYPVNWTVANRVAATATATPTGNPLLTFVNTDLMIKGNAKLSPGIVTPNPGYALQRARDGSGFSTDEALLKAAMRRGFKVGAANAFSVFEKTS